MTRAQTNRRAGFTLLELLIAMSVFAMLGTAAVVLMRQGAGMFAAGAKQNELADRQDAFLPELRADLLRLTVPDSLDPPVQPPDEKALGSAVPPPAPPPVGVRLRSGMLVLREPADTSLKTHPCTYLAFVIGTGDEGHDPVLRTAGDPTATGDAPKPFAKNEVDKAASGVVFQATGGLMEVCWIAVPLDPRYPSVLSVFRGYRAPVGGTESLLDPANFDSIAKIRARFDLRQEGVIHFAVTWRRVTATTWEDSGARGVGDDVAYVGPVWDSSRALERTWPLFRHPTSLPDPSDDVFPQYVKIEATVTPAGPFGYGRGETRLLAGVGTDEVRLTLGSLEPLTGPGGPERFLKIDGEWMGYDPTKVDITTGEVLVQRGRRGTVKAGHEADAEVYVGEAAGEVIRLPVFLDRTIRRARR
jgi:prepilin-type N-terminal cleavage/methylation domain-containing protein